MKSTKAEKAQTARLAMHGRILRCPVDNNPDDCPLHTVRQLPIEKRIAWLKSKSDDEVVALYAQHIDCLDEKLTSRKEEVPAAAKESGC
jgi:hypothetical protein